MNLHIVINKVYLKFFRPLTPVVGYFKYANYYVPLKKKCFDFLFSKRIPSLKDSPLYENAICNALREHVVSGDKIIIIGAGYGVTAALAANLTGDKGFVICYEGSSYCIDLSKKTQKLNGIANIEYRHAIVGENIAVHNEGQISTKCLMVEELEDCDILELDCEGAENIILQNLKIHPRVIIVETHGVFNSSTDLIFKRLQDLGYVVKDYGIAEPDRGSLCVKNDIRVLVGKR